MVATADSVSERASTSAASKSQGLGLHQHLAEGGDVQVHWVLSDSRSSAVFAEQPCDWMLAATAAADLESGLCGKDLVRNCLYQLVVVADRP